MGDTWHVGLVVLVYICCPKGAAENLIKTQEAEHTLLINEVNADSPGEDTSEFVELYHTSGQTAHLDGYYLVFYNGNGNRAYKVLNLQGRATNSQGLFLIGSSSVSPAMVIPKNTIQNGPDAIALYYGKGSYREGMSVTSYGLVDALVHKTKKTDRADTLVRVLTPGREPFLEDPTFRAVDESIERCRGADSQWIFQVAVPTPGTDNHCLLTPQLNSSALLISEALPAAPPGELEFTELQGPHSTALRGVVLLLVDGRTKDIYFTMDVHGQTSPDGLLLIGPAHRGTPDGTNLTLKDIPATSEGCGAVAVYSTSGVHSGEVTPEGLVDALVYTCEPGTARGHLGFLGPSYAVPCKGDRPMSLSRCGSASTGLQFALSEPSPGLGNSCPQQALAVDLHLCLLTPDCSTWTLHHRRMLESLGRVLVSSLEEECSCGVSELYVQGLNLTCVGSLVKVWGQVWARQPEQEQSIKTWLQGFVASPHPFSMDGRVLKTSPECVTPKNAPPMSHSGASFQGWEIALFVVGSLLLLFLLVSLTLCFITRHPQNYSTIEMSEHGEIAADF